MGLTGPQVVVRAVDAVEVEVLEAALPGRLQEDAHDVDAGVGPAAEARSVDQGLGAAGKGGLVPLVPVPPHAVEAQGGVVGPLELERQEVVDLLGRKVGAVAHNHVEVDDDTPLALDGRQVVGRKRHARVAWQRGRLGHAASLTGAKPPHGAPPPSRRQPGLWSEAHPSGSQPADASCTSLDSTPTTRAPRQAAPSILRHGMACSRQQPLVGLPQFTGRRATGE